MTHTYKGGGIRQAVHKNYKGLLKKQEAKKSLYKIRVSTYV